MASAIDLCKRALVALLKKLALAYGVALEVTRDSTAFKARVKAFLRTKKVLNVAKAKFNAFKKVCREVKDKGGAASRWSALRGGVD